MSHGTTGGLSRRDWEAAPATLRARAFRVRPPAREQ